MTEVFVDTAYLVALARRQDQWHNTAVAARSRLGEVFLVTTDEVHTLEVDLLNCGLGHRMYESFEELGASKRWLKQFNDLVNAGSQVSEDDSEAVLKRIERIGKGRFAQRLAEKVTQEDCPAYLKAAIQQVIGKLGHDTE